MRMCTEHYCATMRTLAAATIACALHTVYCGAVVSGLWLARRGVHTGGNVYGTGDVRGHGGRPLALCR